MMGIWIRIAAAALLDGAMIQLLVRSISRSHFRALKWTVAFSAGLIWGAITALLTILLSDSQPILFNANGLGILNVVIVTLRYSGIGLVIWWLASLNERHSAVLFCALGGFSGVLESILGIYRLNQVNSPIFQQVTAPQILVFAFFEYMIFWTAILILADLFYQLWQSNQSRMHWPE